MRLAIYNQNCIQAGQSVSVDRLEQAELANDGRDCDPWEDCDWTVYDDSPGELLRLAEITETNARRGGAGLYDRRIARTLREAVCAELPDLEPSDPDTVED